MRIMTMAAALALLGATIAWAQAPAAYAPAFPRAGARLVLDNRWGAAWDVGYVPGVPTPMHRHERDSIGVELADSSVTVTAPDGAAETFPSRRGESYYMPRGTTHVELTPVGFAPRHAVIIELKDGAGAAPVNAPASAGGGVADFPGAGARKVAESPRVILWNYDWPVASGAGLRLTRNSFIVIIDGGVLAGADGGTETVTSGQVLFRPAGSVLSEVAAKGPVRGVVAELK